MTDLAIIGGGPAGLAAALYAVRGGASVRLLEELFAKGEGRRVSKELTVAEADGAFTGRVRWVFNENIAESVDFSVEE